jgi:Uma2 family endonuclease
MAAPAIVKQHARYEDLLRVPEHLVGEIVDGDLYASPRPSPRHARASSIIGVEIGGPFDRGRGGPGGWWILDEPELHLGPEVLVPDVAGWKRERLPTLPDAAFFTLPPDWVCEVLSPSTETLDRAHKLPAHAREGVAFAWLINPLTKTLEVYRREEARWLLLAAHEGDGIVRSEPFDAIELELAALWVT